MAGIFDIKPFDFSNFGKQPKKVDPFAADSNLIKEQLRGTIESEGMSEFLKQTLLGGTKKIGQAAGSSREAIRESGASSGFRGANVNALTQSFESEAGAVGELTTGVGGVAEQQKAQALQQLIGVNQFDITTAEGKRQFEKMFGLKERELQAMIDAQGGDIGSIIGNILGFGAGAAVGGAGAGIGSIFEGFFT